MKKFNASLNGFINVAVGIFVVLYVAYYFGVESQDLINPYIEWHTQMASNIMNSLMGEQTTVHRTVVGIRNEIRTHDVAYVQVTPGSYIFFFLALFAAILAWPSSSWVRKTVFLLFSAPLCLGLHLLQTILSLNIEIWWVRLFDVWSQFGSPLLLILVVITYFLLWIKVSGRHPMTEGSDS